MRIGRIQPELFPQLMCGQEAGGPVPSPENSLSSASTDSPSMPFFVWKKIINKANNILYALLEPFK